MAAAKEIQEAVPQKNSSSSLCKKYWKPNISNHWRNLVKNNHSPVRIWVSSRKFVIAWTNPFWRKLWQRCWIQFFCQVILTLSTCVYVQKESHIVQLSIFVYDSCHVPVDLRKDICERSAFSSLLTAMKILSTHAKGKHVPNHGKTANCYWIKKSKEKKAEASNCRRVNLHDEAS